VLTVFVVALLGQFNLYFQQNSDDWLILLGLDLIIAGSCWVPVLRGWRLAAAWGLFGGLCALISPVVGLTWGLLSLLLAWRQRAWSRLPVAMLAAGLTLTPWTVRNYLVFGRVLPVKSNLAYDLYQSQCLQPDGLLQLATLRKYHPNGRTTEGFREYKALGEMAFLDRKREQFWEAVWADPADFLDRVIDRFDGATLWYVPFDRVREPQHPRLFWFHRLTHPLPFLALLILLFVSARQPLHWAQWTVISVYGFYLLPYVLASYYERYAIPLVGVKVLLVIWAADLLLGWRRQQTKTPGT
jgi:hypothetical protein